MVEYCRGPLAEGKAGNICGRGDRLPWVEPTSTGGADNFTPFASRAWQVHLQPDRVTAYDSSVALKIAAGESARRVIGVRRLHLGL